MATAESIAARLRELEPLDGEVWRPVAGFDDCYHISNMGRIKSLERKAATWNGGRTIHARIMSPTLNRRNGYFAVNLQRARRIKTRLVHALVLEAFVGPAPDGYETRHLNGVRNDNRLSNLAWGSKLENMRDQYAHGTRKRGARAGAKLTPKMVDMILNSGLTGVELSKRLGLGTATICRVRKGKVVATLLGDPPSA